MVNRADLRSIHFCDFDIQCKGYLYFFRPQNKSETCLATIEAVYHFFKEYHSVILKRSVWSYCGVTS